ncbi:peptidyl-prolyl cis-trans isomerase B (cyclophilin B) [Filimonas lacunae]|uniref:peptidylprolyl isomerase n=1 Tax=Filimonas lacunae TaxID=477680 RepID=A0A173M9Z4_9BACT|nr:peptidylprolyl isomerase [Filimonas lacunae]BAV04356.1 peptidyl-prolyl cis-trans isomerase [Filimonas lacunae]SIT31121.1 peptidyl-prolyl cis-trans isomerase B (cyclophilin B) [Filimonas lacunae]
MLKYIGCLLFLLWGTLAHAQSVRVRFTTSKGSFTVMLYDSTPHHRDMFVKAVQKGVYQQALFNRVIKGFVNQGGELDDSILLREQQHPEQKIQRFPAEIKPSCFHKKGALGAGRDDNPEKASFFTQIYFVIGKKYTDAQLDSVERKTGVAISATRRAVYKNIGGIPRLDGDYTIFGEITNGLEIIESINNVPTNKQDVPMVPVTFSVKVLKH